MLLKRFVTRSESQVQHESLEMTQLNLSILDQGGPRICVQFPEEDEVFFREKSHECESWHELSQPMNLKGFSDPRRNRGDVHWLMDLAWQLCNDHCIVERIQIIGSAICSGLL